MAMRLTSGPYKRAPSTTAREVPRGRARRSPGTCPALCTTGAVAVRRYPTWGVGSSPCPLALGIQWPWGRHPRPSAFGIRASALLPGLSRPGRMPKTLSRVGPSLYDPRHRRRAAFALGSQPRSLGHWLPEEARHDRRSTPGQPTRANSAGRRSSSTTSSSCSSWGSRSPIVLTRFGSGSRSPASRWRSPFELPK